MPPSCCPICKTTLTYLNKNKVVCENCISLNNMSHCHYKFSYYATYQLETAFIETNNSIFKIVNFYFWAFQINLKLVN